MVLCFIGLIVGDLGFGFFRGDRVRLLLFQFLFFYLKVIGLYQGFLYFLFSFEGRVFLVQGEWRFLFLQLGSFVYMDVVEGNNRLSRLFREVRIFVCYAFIDRFSGDGYFIEMELKYFIGDWKYILFRYIVVEIFLLVYCFIGVNGMLLMLFLGFRGRFQLGLSFQCFK